jgi:hypothetical protein
VIGASTVIRSRLLSLCGSLGRRCLTVDVPRLGDQVLPISDELLLYLDLVNAPAVAVSFLRQ